MRYEEALKYLYSFLNYEIQTDFSYQRDLNLKRMAFLMNLFDHPHEKVPYVLVGGTKGKGSTAYLLQSILKECGYKVGLYTSPHLQEPTERILISGDKIPKEDFAALFQEIKEVLEKKPFPSSLGKMTFFELFTTATFLYFAQKGLDIGVLEVGLGGRLDATNIIHPLVSILTPVSYDHQDKLGNTLAKIAREKIPIVKEESYLVSGRQVLGVQTLFKDWSKRKRTQAFFLGKDFEVEIEELTDKGSLFNLRMRRESLKNLFVSLPGRFQIDNAACAVQAAKLLHACFSFHVDERSIQLGLQAAVWPGRFQIIGKEPLVILDGAHNGASFRALRESTKSLFPQKDITMILAISKDKDLERIVRELVRFKLKRLIVTQVKNPRAFPSEVLAARIRQDLASVEESSGLKESIERAFQRRGSNNLFLITGSLFLVGEAQNLFASAPELAEVA